MKNKYDKKYLFLMMYKIAGMPLNESIINNNNNNDNDINNKNDDGISNNDNASINNNKDINKEKDNSTNKGKIFTPKNKNIDNINNSNNNKSLDDRLESELYEYDVTNGIKFVDIAKSKYFDEMKDFIKSAKKFIKLGDQKDNYEFFKKYGYAGYNALKLADYDLKIAAELMGAMWVNYDLLDHGESVLISAMGVHGKDEQYITTEIIKKIWGVPIGYYQGNY